MCKEGSRFTLEKGRMFRSSLNLGFVGPGLLFFCNGIWQEFCICGSELGCNQGQGKWKKYFHLGSFEAAFWQEDAGRRN
jgi:hypothetical protein